MFLGLGLGLLAKGPLTLILAGLPIGLWALLGGAGARSGGACHGSAEAC